MACALLLTEYVSLLRRAEQESRSTSAGRCRSTRSQPIQSNPIELSWVEFVSPHLRNSMCYMCVSNDRTARTDWCVEDRVWRASCSHCSAEAVALRLHGGRRDAQRDTMSSASARAQRASHRLMRTASSWRTASSHTHRLQHPRASRRHRCAPQLHTPLFPRSPEPATRNAARAIRGPAPAHAIRGPLQHNPQPTPPSKLPTRSKRSYPLHARLSAGQRGVSHACSRAIDDGASARSCAVCSDKQISTRSNAVMREIGTGTGRNRGGGRRGIGARVQGV
ncbi:hypothetical protein C7974DRAFT_37056 [Boeremia exigua]|uniref:uncharacterized protein n=1 Tax=Boeremia exigua TaxID=749465 RepID=UPI001E8EAF30|nr:uncharacterized protein C7974DRAFT_37056 [Boeremia exigua]KAH6618777.1 hypothetical protein C7974DRAFT_37056 [Boeremia exigua]